MVLLNNVVSGRKPLKEQKNKGNEERDIYIIYIYIFCGRDSDVRRERRRPWSRRGGEGRGKRSAPFLALGSGFQLVQAVNAAISRLGKHPVSSSKF